MATRLKGRLSLLLLSFAVLMFIFPAMAFAQDAGGSPSPAPTIQSDKDDYSPGATVTLTGSNWQSGESVHLYVNDDQGNTWSRDADVSADANGNITDQFNLPDWFVATYSVKATGASGTVATTSFLDSNVQVGANLSTGESTKVVWQRYNSTDCSGTALTGGNNTGTFTLSGSATSPIPSGATSGSIKLTADVQTTTTPQKAFNIWEASGSATSANMSAVSGSGVNVTCTSGFNSGNNTHTYTANYGNTAPSTPGTPSTGSNPNQGVFTLSWTASTDAEGNPITYRLEHKSTSDTSYSLVTGAGNLSTNSFAFTSAAQEDEGTWTYRVQASDTSAAGNLSSAFSATSAAIKVDKTAPETTINSKPADPSNDVNPDFTFTSSETGSTFQCSIDNGSFQSCTSPKSYSKLANGSHTFQVRAIDSAGNVEATPASYTWTIDGTAPSAPVISSPANNSTVGASFTLSGTAEANSTVELFEGTTSKGTTQANASGNWSITLNNVSGGSHTYTAKATDAAGNTSVASSTRTVIVDATAPTATITSGPAAGSTVNSASASFTFSSNETGSTFQCSLDGGAYTTCSSPQNYTNLSDGSHTFSVKATDAVGNTGTPVSRTWIIATNDAPTANAQSVTTNEDTAKSITLTASDADGDNLTYSVVSGPSHGTLSGTGATRTYTPAADYNGSDSFTFKANDGTVDSNTATVSITVTSVNDAPVAVNNSYSTAEDTTLTVAAPGVLSNDTDVDGDALTVTSNTSPSHGSVTLNANGSFTYNPANNYNGPDSFDYTVSDGKGGTATATVNVTVSAVNDAPTANAQSVTTNEDVAKAITLVGNDVEGSSLTYTIVTAPQHGTLTGSGDSRTYTPDNNYNGSDSFTFKVSDGSLDSNTATVSITVDAVNDAPVAKDDSLTTDEDTAGNGNVLTNDTDVDSANLTATKVTGPTHGTLTLNNNGSFSYTPNADYNGSDSFTYKANDGSLDSNTATVNITVKPVNDAPVAKDDSATTDEDTAKDIAVLANDTDVENDSLSVSSFTQPSHGTVTQNADGTLKYNPAANYNGSDSFTYKAKDASLDSNSATVSLTVNAVNDAPVAKDDSLTTDEDTAGNGNVLTNDTDVDSANLTATKVTGPTHGTLTFNANGSYTYTPNNNFNGTDSFTYKANDGSLDSNVATVSITVTAVNDAPVADDQSVSTDEDTPKAVTLSASDVDSTNLSYSIVSGPSHGSLSGTGATRTYTPNADYYGPDSFTFKANDGSLDSNTATVSITVNSVNDAPVAQEDTKTTDEDTPLTFPSSDLVVNDNKGAANESGQTLRVTAVSNATHGTVSLASEGGNITFTPATDFNGQATFDYRVCDNGSPNECSVETATVNVTVNAVNDAPSFTKGANETVNEDAGAQTVTGWATAISAGPADESGQALNFIVTNDNTSLFTATGQPEVSANGTLTYTPAANANGSATVSVKIHDNGGGDDTSATQTFTITVNSVNDAPSFTKGANQTVNEDSGAHSLSWATAISSGPANESGQALNFIVSNDNNGLFSTQPEISANGTLSYTSAPDAYGTATVSVKLHDDGGTANGGVDTSATQTFTITVNSVNDAPVAQEDTKTTDEDTPLTFPSSDLVVNDNKGAANESGQTLRVTAVSNATHGTVSLASEGGNITFTPATDFNGQATFDYRVCDNGSPNECSVETATVNVTVNAVNDAPVADAQSVTTNEDTPKAVTLSASDVDSTNLSYSIVSGPSHGTLSGTGATRTYTPAADYNGSDSFTFKANDGTDDSNVATVSITVNAVNDAPVAVGDSYNTNEDTTLNVAAPGVLGNDTDVDSASLTAVLVSGPSHGTLTLNANGSFTYNPANNYNGPDSFTYKANDGTANSNVVTVSITVGAVNDAPTVTLSGAALADEGQTKTYNFTVNDPDSGDTFTVMSGFPDCGTGGVYIAGSLNPTASGGSFGCRFPDGLANPTVRIQVTDGAHADSNIATQDVTVANVNPTIGPLSVTGNNGIACNGSTNVVKLSFMITDPGVDTHSGTINWGDGTTTQFNGSSVTDAQHSYSAGTYTITVNASDSDGGNAAPKSTTGTENVSLRYNVSELQDPVNRTGMTMSVFKHGSTVPLKVLITDCNNQPVNGLVPRISFNRVSAATPNIGINEGLSTQPNDTNFLMRDAGNGQYIYNLNTKSLADGDATYNATITDSQATQTAPATYGPKVTQNFGLRSK